MNTVETNTTEQQCKWKRGVNSNETTSKKGFDRSVHTVYADDATDVERRGSCHRRDWELPTNRTILYVPKRAQREIFGSS